MDDAQRRDTADDVGQLCRQKHQVVLAHGNQVQHNGVLVHVRAAVLVMRHQLLGALVPEGPHPPNTNINRAATQRINEPTPTLSYFTGTMLEMKSMNLLAWLLSLK